MRSSLARSAVCWLALAACTEGSGSDAPRTNTTSQDLLSSVPAESEVPPGIAAPKPPTLDIAVLGFDRGSHEAPVRVIEMSDYGCGYCRKFHQETWPVLREEFVDAGKIEWKFLPFVSGMFKNSTHATRAAECVMEQGPDLFETMNSRVWNDQRAWKGSGDPDSVLRSFAADAGADMSRYDSCLAEGRRDERVTAATSLAHQVGVRGTPTFFVVGYPPLQGALPTETFQQVLSMVYADATGAGGR